MSDLEMFAPGEGGGEQMSEQAFEQFKEQMKAAAAGLKQLQKDEGKQKKKEDRLTKILLQFFKDPKKKDILLLAARVLEQNIPAHFTLSILVLGEEQFEKEVVFMDEEDKKNHHITPIQVDSKYSSNPKIKADLNLWALGMLVQSTFNTPRMKKTAFDDSGKVKLILIQFAVFVMRDYLVKHGVLPTYSELKEFVENLFAGVFVGIPN
ncbi:MAG: hypothetical protein WCT36_03535 [Candidatus Gracilibacteria bacterium]|jgi:hypothetical protein